MKWALFYTHCGKNAEGTSFLGSIAGNCNKISLTRASSRPVGRSGSGRLMPDSGSCAITRWPALAETWLATIGMTTE